MSKNLFELMPTSQSENVATAALAYLLGLEGKVYDELRKKIGFGDCGVGAISIETEHSFDNRRRIDLLGVTDDCVYGIEVKLGALFSENQLKYYDEKLNEYEKYELIALVPKWLESQTEKSNHPKSVNWVTWEDLIEILKKDDSEDKKISQNLIEFLEPKLEPLLSNFESEFSNDFSEGQIEFLRRFVLHYFSRDVITSRVGMGKKGGNYRGYYLETRSDDVTLDNPRVGYISLQVLDVSKPNPVKMVVLVSDEINVESREFEFLKEIKKEERSSEWVTYESENLGKGYRVFYIDESETSWKQIGESLYELFNPKESA